MSTSILTAPEIVGEHATYGKFSTPPQSLDDAQLVEGHGGEQHFGAVGAAELPCEQPPVLPVVEQVWPDLDPEVVFRVGQCREEGRCDDADNEQPGDGRVSEAGGDHVGRGK